MSPRCWTRTTGRVEMPSVSPIRKSVVEFCGGRSGAVLCLLALRYLFHNQVIQGLGRKEVHWPRGFRGNSILREEPGYSWSKKKEGPFRDSLWI